MSTPKELILGPQIALGETYFDRVQFSRGKMLGALCPATPPLKPASPIEPERSKFSDDVTYLTALTTWREIPVVKAWLEALNDYELHLQYYDLPMTLYIAHARTGDEAFLTYARNAADSFWQHPYWIKSGAKLNFDDGAPVPRHAGIIGLILRALDGRPEMWPWITAYARDRYETWLGMRINNQALHYGVREGAFMLHYAVCLAVAHPDPAVRSEFLAKTENAAVNYFGRLQFPDGSWRWDDVDSKDTDGGTLVGIMQPFMIGLLLHALIDAHQIAADPTVKENIKQQILKACRHLYSDGPYRKDDPIPYDPTKRWRCFWYLYHGGTTLNLTKFEKGGWSLPGNSIDDVRDGRQSISTVVSAYAYAYKLSGDSIFLEAGSELWDSAYGPIDGIHNYMDTDGKGYNQNCRRAGSYSAWAGALPLPLPDPLPNPIPAPPQPEPPAPTPAPEPVFTPSPDGTKAVEIFDSNNGQWTLGVNKETFRNGLLMDRGAGVLYKWLSGVVYLLGTDIRTWYKWDSKWIEIGRQEPGVIVQPPIPEPIPPQPTPGPPAPTPIPVPCVMTISISPSTIPQWGTGKLVVTINGITKPEAIKITSDSGQVVVTPSSRTVKPNATGAIAEFKIQVKKKSANLTVSGPCGVQTFNVPVK